MCMVSMVTHGMGQEYPQFPKPFTLPQLIDISEVLKRLDDLDKKLEAKHCDEPGKAEFFKKLNARIAELERNQARRQKKTPKKGR